LVELIDTTKPKECLPIWKEERAKPLGLYFVHWWKLFCCVSHNSKIIPAGRDHQRLSYGVRPGCSGLHFSLQRCETSPGQRWPSLPSFHSEKVSPNLQPEPLVCQLVLLPLALLSRTAVKSLTASPQSPSVSAWDAAECPKTVPPPSCTSTGPAVSACRTRAPVPLSQWPPVTSHCFVGSVSLLGTQTGGNTEVRSDKHQAEGEVPALC